MRERLRPWIPLLAVLVVVLLAAGALLSQAERGDRTTEDRGPHGTAALAGALERLGLPVERLRLGLHALPDLAPPGSLLIQASAGGLVAERALSGADLHALESFLLAGGTVLTLSDYPSALWREHGVGIDHEALKGASGVLVASPDHLHELTVTGSTSHLTRQGLDLPPEAEALYLVRGFGEDPVPLVASLQVGAGRIVFVTDAWMVSNQGIAWTGNMDFVGHLARRAVQRGGVVVFDELQAGAAAGNGVVAYARRAGLGPAMLLALLAALLFVGRASARFGGADEGAVEAQASQAYVRSMGGLYHRADMGRHALVVLARRLRVRLKQHAGGRWDSESAERWLARERGDSARGAFVVVREDLGRALQSGQVDGDTALELARRTHELEQRLERSRGGRTR